MRIVWKEDSARAVSQTLEQFRQAIELYARQSCQVEAALQEADPDGSNKLLKAIGERFSAAMSRLMDVAKESEQMKEATNHMILTFESCEEQVIGVLNGLDPGRGTEAKETWRETGNGAVARESSTGSLPIRLPRPTIGPTMRFSAFGPTMTWIEELMNQA